MKTSSLRRNLLYLAALYGICLLAAIGCPATNDRGSPESSAAAAERSTPPLKTARAGAAGAATGREPAVKPKFDPIQTNGRFFVGWEKPKLALVISGRQDGYLEPCGCAGLENQKGGLSRRHALLKELSAKGWPLAAVDVGGSIRRFGKQAEIELATTAEALKIMNYAAVGFGSADLRLSADAVAAAVAGAESGQSIFVSANVNLLDLTPRFRIVEAGGMKLGITAVLGSEYQKQVNNADVVIAPAAEALKKVVGQLEGCDQRILLAHASAAETRELAKQFPQFDLVVLSDGADEPPAQAATIADGESRLIETGHKGMYVVVLGFYDDPQQPLRYQRVALDSRYGQSPEMHKLMRGYQDQLKTLGWQGLDLRPATHPRTRSGEDGSGKFVGAESCRKCHPTSYGIWSKTPHAHATETLAKLNPPRQYDPQCISCHATGWDPQEHSPYVNGFDSLAATPHLAGNQCENCHGPAGAHVKAEAGRSDTRRENERTAMRVTAAYAKDHVCLKCHDLDNSPSFATDLEAGFTRYWPKVEHRGKR